MTATYQKILVTLDGSTFAAQALPHAQAIAELSGAQLILFQVAHDVANFVEVMDDALDTGLRQQRLIDQATEHLQELIDEFKLHKINVEAQVEVGDPAETIIHYAEQNQIELIVMSTHGRSGLARWVYGSVADKVLRAAHCPVLLVRAALVEGAL